ncbi:sensor histidine kinase [Candidatus Pelagibacter communis]|uniref:sensor histidine kinase n=1 Tax=Pelagibacter ubique TaxID=198252 RepID=UPI00094C7194|nr:HAMP domain-containing sensor histidine kinase [Candidatus Pelagibacter ubique]
MFYGLNKFIKQLLPKRLFYRALLIVAAPIIILQITISIVFFDSLWIKTNKGMTNALIGEIKFFLDAYDNEDYNKENLINLFEKHHNFTVKFVSFGNLPKQDMERWFSPMDRTLRRELKSRNLSYWFDTTKFKGLIELKIKHLNGYFEFYIPKERVTSSSARLFALWITFPAFLLIIIALIFLKNQTRPIVNLAKASEKFGRGEDVGEFRPSGAQEIRQAGFEFDRMRKRILRHLNQRSEMLSGISHDLRTPLTRIKLQLAFIKDNKISNKLSEDIDEMEKMLNEYLQFASSTFSEKDELFNLSKTIETLIKKYNNSLVTSNIEKNITFNGRKNLMVRCISNIIDNALKYGKKVKFSVKKLSKIIVITIEDDGPGVPKSEYGNVFKPFYKINKGRGDSKSSVGLGLSIASDVVRSHGGKIGLNKSKLGGLCVKISLPF